MSLYPISIRLFKDEIVKTLNNHSIKHTVDLRGISEDYFVIGFEDCLIYIHQDGVQLYKDTFLIREEVYDFDSEQDLLDFFIKELDLFLSDRASYKPLYKSVDITSNYKRLLTFLLIHISNLAINFLFFFFYFFYTDNFFNAFWNDHLESLFFLISIGPFICLLSGIIFYFIDKTEFTTNGNILRTIIIILVSGMINISLINRCDCNFDPLSNEHFNLDFLDEPSSFDLR